MGKIGKISVIPKDFSSAFPTMEKSLREKGMSRMPGTVAMKFPYRDLNRRYRTGLDEEAAYIKKMEKVSVPEAAAEKKRVLDLRLSLEAATGLDLSPTSSYYNYLSRDSVKVQPVKLIDGDNIFNLDDPWQAITYCWLSAHPTIARSLAAYKRGEYAHDTVYFINDEDIEGAIIYQKKKNANDAIIKFNSWSLEKRKKVARLLDLPITDDTREELVYNIVDDFLKSQVVLNGVHKGIDPIKIFGVYADLKDDVLFVKDIVEQAFTNHIYRERKGGRIYEGELEIFVSKDELIEHLLDDANQGDLMELEKKLQLKKFAQVI